MRRVVIALLSSLFLAACGEDTGKAFLSSQTPPALPPRAWAPDGWAWGAIRIGEAPELRYGVVGPAGRPKGHVLFVTGYGEPAEVYFEVARDLLDRGHAVWVLEPHGQGGSGRFRGPRDVGRSAGFDVDADAVRMLATRVIRPRSGEPLVLAGWDSGALPVLLALQAGTPEASGAFLWSPDLSAVADPRAADWFTRAGLGLLRAEGAAWTRPAGDMTRPSRRPLAWQMANPDLRIGGRGHSWLKAEAAAVAQATDAAALSRILRPVAVHARPKDRPAERACRAIPGCRLQPASAGGAIHLVDDAAARTAWRDALIAFVEGAGEPPADHAP